MLSTFGLESLWVLYLSKKLVSGVHEAKRLVDMIQDGAAIQGVTPTIEAVDVGRFFYGLTVPRTTLSGRIVTADNSFCAVRLASRNGRSMPAPTMCGWPGVSTAFGSVTFEVRLRFVPFPRASLCCAVVVTHRIVV